MPRTRIDMAVQNLQFARRYTLTLLDDLTPEEWFQQPPGIPSQIGWQVGHLAMAQYALTMLRIRGKEPGDAEWIDNDFFRRFQKGSSPAESKFPTPPVAEVRAVLDRVHAQSMQELSGYTDEELDVKLPEPHAVFDTKLGSIIFCAAHEMLHAGQIGLLRRALGKPPLR